MKHLMLVMLGWLALVAQAQAASFDCAKASTKVEHLICGDTELLKLDAELNGAYRAALQHGKGIETIKDIKEMQMHWLRERDDCQDTECLEISYRKRIDELNPNKRRLVVLLTKNKPLCESYISYVEHEVAANSQHVHHASPMCQRSFEGKYPSFAAVRWHEVKPDDYQELAVQAYRYVNYWPWGSPGALPFLRQEQFKGQLDVIKLNFSNDWWHMWIGEADVGNTGHIEKLLRVENGRCGEPNMMGRPASWTVSVMVVGDDLKSIDVSKSEWILGVSVLRPPVMPPKNYMYIPGLHENDLEAYDVFVWNGSTYFDRVKDTWVVVPYEKNDDRFSTYSVYQVKQEQPQRICYFKLKKQKD